VRTIAVALSLVVGITGTAQAEKEGAASPPSKKRRALALTAAVVPGALVHGSGHYVLGDKQTAWRLLKMEGVGLGLLGAGVGVLGLTGSDEHLAALYVPMMVSGATILAGSFLADLLGVTVAGSSGTGVARPIEHPREGAIAHAAIGYRYVNHPALDVSHLASASAAVRAGRFRIAAAAESETRGRGFRAQQAVVAYRPPWRPLSVAALELGLDGAHRVLSADGVSSYPVAAWAEVVWDLGGCLPRIPGVYARGRLGAGVEMIDYGTVPGRVDEASSFLVAVAGLGFRIDRVDAEFSYDHRQDGLPGGGFFGRLPGMLGSIAATGRLHLTQGWALASEARYGTGLTTWLAIERSF